MKHEQFKTKTGLENAGYGNTPEDSIDVDGLDDSYCSDSMGSLYGTKCSRQNRRVLIRYFGIPRSMVESTKSMAESLHGRLRTMYYSINQKTDSHSNTRSKLITTLH